MEDARIVAAQALAPLLDAFHSVNGRVLRRVFRIYVHGCLDRLILQFDQLSLAIGAQPDTDTIEVMVEKSAATVTGDFVDATNSLPWSRFVGEPFGWGWIAMNQQGFCDGVLLSFQGITPEVLLNVVASSLKENVIIKQRTDTL